MIVFNTKFNVTSELDKGKFFEEIAKWINESQHYDLKIDHALICDADLRKPYLLSATRCLIECRYFENDNVYAVKFVNKMKNSDVWTTYLYLATDPNQHVFACTIKYDRGDENSKHFTAKAPLIVKQIANGYGDKVGDYLANGNYTYVHYKHKQQAEKLAQIIANGNNVNMPLVYVSIMRNPDDGLKYIYPLDLDALADRLAGQAIVLVEKSHIVARKMHKLTDGKCAYHGAVLIMYQNKCKDLLNVFNFESGEDMSNEIAKRIFAFQRMVAIDDRFNWEKLCINALSSEISTLTDLLDVGERDCKDYKELINQQDLEIASLRELVEKYKSENYTLSMRYKDLLDSVNSKSNDDNQALLYIGNEKDLYEGEQHDMLLAILDDVRKNLDPNARRKHVLDSIVDGNHKIGVYEQKLEDMKTVWFNYDGPTSSFDSEMKDIGFTPLDDRKHNQYVFYDDERYKVILSSTPSDKRGAKNNFAETRKKLF